MTRKPSDLEAAFDFHWKALGYPPVWLAEFRATCFGTRRFRLDRAEPNTLTAVELDGGTWTGGRHVTGAGYSRDCVKHNMATAAGWRVFHLTADMLALDPAHHLGQIAEAMGLRTTEAGGAAHGNTHGPAHADRRPPRLSPARDI